MSKAKKSKKRVAPKASPNRTLKHLFKTAKTDDIRKLAKRAGTSLPHLRHVAAGRRNISAELAQKLAHASQGFPKPLLLSQVDLCKACKVCPIRKRP